MHILCSRFLEKHFEKTLNQFSNLKLNCEIVNPSWFFPFEQLKFVHKNTREYPQYSK